MIGLATESDRGKIREDEGMIMICTIDSRIDGQIYLLALESLGIVCP